MIQQFALVLSVVGPEQLLLDVLVLLLRAVNLQTLRLTHYTGSELLNTRRESSAEHHGLLAGNGQLVYFGQVIRKTQIKHPVGFVHHEKLNLVEFDLHGSLKIEQAPGRGNHEVGVLQLGDL